MCTAGTLDVDVTNKIRIKNSTSASNLRNEFIYQFLKNIVKNQNKLELRPGYILNMNTQEHKTTKFKQKNTQTRLISFLDYQYSN